MTELRHLAMSKETRARFEHLLDHAWNLGIDASAVSAAGPVALRALLALKNAVDSTNHADRARYADQVRDAVQVLEHRETPELVQQFQTRLVALEGRGNDTEVAHVARGELVVPVQLQSPTVLASLTEAAAPYGIPLDMLRVGTVLNRINPATGAPEFGIMDWISGLFKKESPEAQPSSDASTSSSRGQANGPSPTDSFDFDPNGAGELRSAVRHPIAAFKAIGIQKDAYRNAAENFGRDALVNGAGDAYRHALASSMLTNSVGPEIAKKFTDAHERSFPNSDAECQMDLENNKIGRSLATGDDKADQVRILEMARKGQLRTLP